jgi:hypothetical protein
MTLGRLVCEPLSVREVIDDPDLAGKQVAVHGLPYLGEGCAEDEFLLLPKDGPSMALVRSQCPRLWTAPGAYSSNSRTFGASWGRAGLRASTIGSTTALL